MSASIHIPDIAALTDEQRRGVLDGSLDLSEVGLAPAKPTVELLASLLPEGLSEKGKPTPINAGELTSLLTDVMRRRPGFIRWNLMSQEVEVNGNTLSAHEQECIYIPIQQRGYSVRKGDAKDALAMAAQSDTFHPVQDYLNAIAGTPPADITRLASQYLRPADLQGEQTIYDRMLHKTLVAAVRRAFNPGCQHDTCCVLKGSQGIRKTTFWRTLFKPHFAIFRGKIGDKDALLTVHGNWALELGELDCITSQTHAGHLKNFLTTEVDHFRPPYGAKATPCPRPSIFVGSCNRGDFLYDDTGERRWWIIPCDIPSKGKINIEALASQADAIWAAAVADYKAGVVSFLTDDDEELNADLNLDYTGDNILEGPVALFLQRNLGTSCIDPNELFDAVQEKAPGTSTQKIQTWIKEAMTREGWALRRGSAADFGKSRPRKWFPL